MLKDEAGAEVDAAADAALAKEEAAFAVIEVPPPLERPKPKDAAEVGVKNPVGVVDVAVPVDSKVPEGWGARAEGPAVFVHPTVAVTVTVTVAAPVGGEPARVGAETAGAERLETEVAGKTVC